VRVPARRSDDSDVIRARLRALLAEGQHRGGWVPADDDLVGPGRQHRWPDEDDTDEFPVAELPDDRSPGLPGGLGRHRAPDRTARLDPGRPGAWALWAAAVVAALAVVGWTWVGRPAVEQVPAAVTTTAPAAAPTAPAGPAPAATSASAGGTVVVSVVGLVASPGLVTLPAGARVADALAAAGGLLPEADPASVNAAAVLSDGQQIAIGVPGAVAPPASSTGAAGGAAPGSPLDLNAATVADLDALPGIGPVLAQRIVDHRTAHGPFTSVDQLDDVSGIGPAIFADLADRVRV
jgi:competence protein ComEA